MTSFEDEIGGGLVELLETDLEEDAY